MPQINPWATDTHVICQMAVFLPVALPPKHAEHGHLLWFDELMTLWDTCYNSQCGVSVSLQFFYLGPSNGEMQRKGFQRTLEKKL